MGPGQVGVRLRRAEFSAQLGQRGQDLVLGLDGLRIGLVGTLRGHHVDQLGGQVDVRVFQRARAQCAELAGARFADDRLA